MAFFFGDGFDLYALSADALLGYWDSGNTAFALATGRFSGSRAMIGNPAGGALLVKSSGQNDAVHHIVCAFQQTAALSGTNVGLYFQLTDGTTNQCCIVFRSDGAILLTSATPSGTTLATYAGAVTAASTWYAFEFEIVINNTTGSFAVRKNGNTSNDFLASSLNTRPGTNSYANKITVGVFSGSVSTHYCDDLLWRSDAASVPWVGDIRCYTRRPASDAAVQWTPSTSALVQTPVTAFTTANINNGAVRFTPFTAGVDGAIGAATVTLNAGYTGNLKCAIFASSGSAPTAALGSANTITNPTSGSNTLTFATPVNVTRGTQYWIGFCSDTTSGSFSVGAGTSGYTGSMSFATFPGGTLTGGSASSPAVCSLTTTVGSNAALVADFQQDAAASYVYSSTVGQADLYTLTGIDSTPTTIIGVTTRALAQKSDAGTRIITADLKSGGTTVHSGSGVLNTTWSWTYRTDLADPNTGAAWTPTGVNNAQIGVTVTS